MQKRLIHDLYLRFLEQEWMKKASNNEKGRRDRERKAAFSMKKRLFLLLNEIFFEEKANDEILLMFAEKDLYTRYFL